MTLESSLIRIDRSTLFNPAEFLGAGWGEIPEQWEIAEQDEVLLTAVDLATIRLETTLKGREQLVGVRENIFRLKERGYTRLDAKILQMLWENQSLIPESWKEETFCKTTHIFFDGTTLVDRRSGNFGVLYLLWNARGEAWEWAPRLISQYRRDNDLSAVVTVYRSDRQFI